MPWQAQPWGFTQAREHPQGTTVLVLGILSLVVCQILGPFAWKIGSNALKEMDSQPDVTWSNRGNITAGRILGIVSTVLMLVGALFFVLWLIFAVAVVSST